MPFQLEVTVDGASAGRLEASFPPSDAAGKNVYVTRFEVAADGSAELSAGGAYPDASLTSLPAGFDLATAAATPILREVPLLGAISNAAPFLTYSFAGVANELISVNTVSYTHLTLPTKRIV